MSRPPTDPHGPDSGPDLGEMYAEHHPHSQVPVEEMWTVVSAALPTRRRWRRSTLIGALRPVGPVGLTAAAGVLIALGIGIGRSTLPTEGAVPAEASSMPSNSGAVRSAAMEQLAGVEPLLTMLDADVRAGHVDPEIGRWARRQLTVTRLALDGSAGGDPEIRSLLEDLELILIQVAGLDALTPVRAGEELTLIAEGLDGRSLLSRIRHATGVGP